MFYAFGCRADRIMLSGIDLGFKHHYYCRDTKRDNDFEQDRFTSVETFQKNLTREGIDTPFVMAQEWVKDFMKNKKIFRLGENNNGSNTNRGQAVPGQA